ncbi:hypothetical protein ETB97_008170 [Aspergillus alliaceus]|uniref:Uncharacterized protein n=1 Tax=Petromyces alliaceus TaxID=209559 RepID=A0A8H5ZTA4_PETAA|nr:hypothetical protein ETB97_008170 [Aspergillus burnettii]
MTIKQHPPSPLIAPQGFQKRDAGRDLIDDENFTLSPIFCVKILTRTLSKYRDSQMQLPQNSHKDMEPAEYMWREDCVAANLDVKGSVAGFFETMRFFAVGGVDCYFVAAGLEGEGDVYDEAFGAADAQVWVDDCYRGWHFGESVWSMLDVLYSDSTTRIFVPDTELSTDKLSATSNTMDKAKKATSLMNTEHELFKAVI